MGRSPIENLPSDIIIDILARLPAKSLLQFRCVRKSWRSLLSDPKFIKTHLHRAISDDYVGPRKLLLPSYPYFQSIDFEPQNNNNPSSSPSSSSSSMVLEFLKRPNDPDDIPVSVSVSGSCNGLVCIIFERDKIVFCNPCTRVSRELPKPSIMSLEGDDVILTDGFGYDSSADDYKLLLIAASSSSGNTQMDVFSLNSNLWKRVEYINPSIVLDGGQGVFLNGALHWITHNSRLIVSFYLATEEFRELVPIPSDHGDRNYLIELGGCLSVVCCHSLLNRFEVWMMKEYGVEASWTKLFTYPLSINYMVPLCLSKDGEQVLVDLDGEALKMYDLDVEELTLRNFDLEEMPYRNLDVGVHWLYSSPATYIETLVSPIGNVED